MPKKATDYTRTIIYKIEHNENKELVYVGSTTDFTRRKCCHKSCCYNEDDKSFNLKVYKMIRENGGWNEFQMLEIKKFPCNDKREAEAEEERCRIELKANMNSYKAFINDTEKKEKQDFYNNYYRENNREKIKIYSKKYREDNKEDIIEKKKIYYQNNKDKVNDQKKKWCENNLERVLEQSRNLYQKNKDKIKMQRKAIREAKKGIQNSLTL